MLKKQIGGSITYKKQKGFTLIELLAVIVILAVIALILTPIVSGIIKTAKKNAFESTGYGILESTKLYYSKKVGDLETDLTFTCNNDTCTSDEEKLEFKGNINGSGTVLLFQDGNIALCLENSNYATIKNINDERLSTTEQGTCEFDEETKEYSVNASIPASQYQALQAQYDNLYSSLGTTDISNIGDGTVTGAIKELASNESLDVTVLLDETIEMITNTTYNRTVQDLSNYKYILVSAADGSYGDSLFIPSSVIEYTTPSLNFSYSHSSATNMFYQASISSNTTITMFQFTYGWSVTTRNIHFVVLGIGKINNN